MRREHHVGLVPLNRRDHLGHRAGNPGRLLAIVHTPRLQHGGLGRNAAHVKDLRPAVAEPAIANHQHLFVLRKLARYGLHSKGAAARHQHGRLGVVHLFQDGGNVLHYPLKALRHMVERTVGIDD